MFDTHCHLQTDAFDEDRDAILQAAREIGVTHFMVPAIDRQSFPATRALANSHKDVYYALGIHPHSAAEWGDDVRQEIVQSVGSDSKLRAIGEIGLDYYYDFAPKEVQRKTFAEQIALAKELRLPVVIHTRDSDDDVWSIVNEHYGPGSGADAGAPKGQFHCFSGTVEFMQKAVSLGFSVSFTGNITFKKSTLSDVVREVPLESVLLETDSPYLAPVPHRGKRNTPIYLPLIAQKIAEIKQIDVSQVMQQTFENSLKLFQIPKLRHGAPLLVLLITVFSALTTTESAHAQRNEPAGALPPDSVMTPERRKAEEMRKRQQEELAREAEQHRLDSIRDVQRQQDEMARQAVEQVRQDSIKAAERIEEARRQEEFLKTPMPWKAIGVGGGVGIGNVPMSLQRKGLSPTSVLSTTFDISSQLTRRLDIDLSFNHWQVGESFPGDSVYNYGPGTPAAYTYGPGAFQPRARLIRSEYADINTVGLDLRYVITRPTAQVSFYFGLGYSHITVTNHQHYLQAIDSVTTASTESIYDKSFSRGAIDVLFGLRHDFELGRGFTLTPYLEMLVAGAFQGEQQDVSFVFQTEHDQLIWTQFKGGVTLYFGWFGVPRLQ